MKDLFYEMNPWWEEDYELKGIKREKYLNILETYQNNKDIILVTGLRRIGKTTILKQYIYHLINLGISAKKICYLSLDSYAFKGISIRDLVKTFRQINNIEINEKVYLFLDEITCKPDFSQELKNFYDLENSKIFASSSSASVLVNKKAYLTGRTRTIEIEPLSFEEFLIFKNYKAKKSERYLLENYFKKYMEMGGIPEYVLSNDPTYITNLVDDIISKDIISLYGIKKTEIIKDLFKLLCERVGKTVSYKKLGNILEISKDTVREYIKYFQETYLFYIVEKRGKLNEKILSEKKLYCRDVGIKNVTTGFRDLGAIYENLVFLKIKDKKPNYVKEDGYEIDFWYKDYLIEAKYGQKLKGKQKEIFDKLDVKNKIIANGIDFFLKG